MTDPDTDPNPKPVDESNPSGNVPDKNTAKAQKENIGPLPASKMRMSGVSRLAFTMPTDIDSLALSYEQVLAACATWPMRLSSLAVPPPSNAITGDAAQVAKNTFDPAGLFVHTANGVPTKCSMKGLVTTPIGQPNEATYSSDANLSNFKINLFGFIIIWFDLLKFSSKPGAKADVVVELHPDSANEKSVEFGGPLEFVNQLAEIIPMDGFSDPPNIAVSPSGISASYSLAIPSIQVGIFALSNLSIGAGFALPFNNEPMQVRFNFSEKQNPFSLTVSLFGGGAFFAIGIGTEGVNEIEAAIEFGAAIAIDLGVASGGI